MSSPPVWDFPLGLSFECLKVTMTLGVAQPILWVADISTVVWSFHPGGWWRWGFFLWSVWQWCSPPRWLWASRDTAYPVSSWVPSSCFHWCEASSLQTVFQWNSVHFTLASTCSHPKVLSTCEIRRIENSVCLLQPDKDLFPLRH